MSAGILATYMGSGRSYRIMYIVISDEDFDAGQRPVPADSTSKVFRYKKLSSITDIQADRLNLSRALIEQRKRNKERRKT